MSEIAGATAGTGVVLLVIAFMLTMCYAFTSREDHERLYAALAWIACTLGVGAIIAAIWINVLT